MSFNIDLDKLKAKPPTRDATFYIAAIASMLLAILDARSGGVSQGSLLADAAPVTAWLAGHGYLRGQSVAAAGEVAKSQAIAQATLADPDAEATNAPTGATKPGLPLDDAQPGETVEDYTQ